MAYTSTNTQLPETSRVRQDQTVDAVNREVPPTDGKPDDHRRLRRALPGVADSYDHVSALLPYILRTPRVVVTQTIAPAIVADHEIAFGEWLVFRSNRKHIVRVLTGKSVVEDDVLRFAIQ